MKLSVVVLISGRGSNLKSVLEAAQLPDSRFQIVGVISNVPGAGGLDHAKAHDVPAFVIDHKAFSDRAAFEAALASKINQLAPGLICLAGFMRILSGDFVRAWRDRLINIHPSLLPSFKGLNTHARVLDAGVRFTGCTVHFVRPETDDGPIIIQAAVPVYADDSEATIAVRVLAEEHRILPLAL
ncbi:MAG: phosphoribosylglycinamide formyltransferase, partial [Pseudomonadota bacterium]